MRIVSRMALAAAVVAGAVATVAAASSEDDLAVVKRAVAQAQPAPSAPVVANDEPPARAEGTDDEWARRDDRHPRATRSGREPQWLKVRITEKGAKKARVNVNLPLSLVRALGDDFPIDLGRRRGWREGRDGREHTIRMGEVLAALEAGQSLVEIDDDESTVRVWVE